MFLVNGSERLATHLLHENSDVMFAGVLVGNQPGQIWVDHRDTPACALVWSTGLNGFTFFGKPSLSISPAAFTTFFHTQIDPFLQQKGITDFEFSRELKEWDTFLAPIINDVPLKANSQFVYLSSSGQHGEPALELPASFYAVELNESFLRGSASILYSNHDFVTSYILEFWHSIEDFLEKGYGYAALTTDHHIASICVSTAVYKNTHAVGTETLESYRRKGLSSTLAQLIRRRLQQEGITVWWDCMDSNIASQKTAEKAGLTLHSRYEVAWFSRVAP